MRRRMFITGIGSLIVMQGTGLAQTPRVIRKIGYLHPLRISISPPPISLSSMRPVWQRLGYVEGETILLRGADGDPNRLPELAAELISLEVGVLIAVGPVALRAASQATKTTPIVAVDLETDPVRAGLAATFGRPDGNAGLFLDQPAVAGKWLELLREAAPWIERIALVWEPTSGTDQLEAARVAARAIGIESLVLEVRSTESYREAFRNLGGEHRTGIVQLGSLALTMPASRLGDAALKYRFPTISFYTPHAKAGSAMDPISKLIFRGLRR